MEHRRIIKQSVLRRFICYTCEEHGTIADASSPVTIWYQKPPSGKLAQVLHICSVASARYSLLLCGREQLGEDGVLVTAYDVTCSDFLTKPVRL